MNDAITDLRRFAAGFFRLSPTQLPQTTETLERALVAEAVRLALYDKTPKDGGWNPVHILALRNWADRKLRGVIRSLREGDTDRFTEALNDPQKPNLVFLGDLLELEEGYYAPSPTRAVMIDGTTAALISGLPTFCLPDLGESIRVKGVSRIIVDTSHQELKDLGIPLQERDAYIGIQDQGFGRQFLEQLIENRDRRPWGPREGWMIYQGSSGNFGFGWGKGRGKEVLLSDGVVSLWREQPEYGPTQYWLKIIGKNGESEEQMLKVPSRFFKHICFNIDYIAGNPRTVAFEKEQDGVRVSCDFRPPAPQVRWLHAIGAQYLGFQSDEGVIAWLVESEQKKATMEVFDTLAVEVEERT